MELSVVVPAFNESGRLPHTLPHLWRTLKRRFETFEILVVDDGSSDDTVEVVRSFMDELPGLELIESERNRGKGHAVRAGVLRARGDYVLFSDADLSTPPREIGKLLGALKDGADVAIGSRARAEARIVKCQPWYRVLMGKVFNGMVRLLAVGGISDTQCGFKCFKREFARDLFLHGRIDGFCFDVELLVMARKWGLDVREVGVLWRNDPDSKVSPLRHSAQMFRDLLRIRWYELTGCYQRPALRVSRIETWSSR